MLEFRNADVKVGRVPVLQDISVTFETGKITTIVGPNGSGKTTLIQTLNGMSTLAAGQIIMDGMDYLSLPMRERARYLSFLPQFRENSPNISVEGLVEHGRFPYMGFSRKMRDEDWLAVRRALNFTQMYEYRGRMVHELSGGQKQRAYLAMLLAQDCPYMILDEPTSFLDLSGQREIYQLIEKLKEQGKTIILVLHDLSSALRLSDHVVVMKDRKIAGAGTPEECLDSGLLKEVFECEIHKAAVDGMEGMEYYLFT